MPTYGFDGTVDEVALAKMAGFMGSDYGYGSEDDWKVSIVAGADRTVKISAGTGYGHFILDEATPETTIQLDAIGSGTRWDLICRRRNWSPQGGGTSVFTKVTGTAAANAPMVIPSGRLVGPGTTDDQPIALVQVTAGQSIPTQIFPLRTWASKIISAPSLLAIPNARLGTWALVGDSLYRRTPDTAGNPTWANWPPVLQKTITGTPGTDWGLHSFSIAERDGNRRDAHLFLRKTGAAVVPGAQGQLGDQTIFTLDDEWRPPGDMVVPILYTGAATGAAGYDFFTTNALLYKTGALVLAGLVPGTQLNTRAASDTGYSLKATISFSKGA